MDNKYFNMDDLVIANITMYEYVNTGKYETPIKTYFYRQIYLKVNEDNNKGFVDIFKDKYIKKISNFYKNPIGATVDYSLFNLELSPIEKCTKKISYKRLKQIYLKMNHINEEKLNSNIIYLNNYRKR